MVCVERSPIPIRRVDGGLMEVECKAGSGWLRSALADSRPQVMVVIRGNSQDLRYVCYSLPSRNSSISNI